MAGSRDRKSHASDALKPARHKDSAPASTRQSATVHGILALQRFPGNAAVAQLLAPVQRDATDTGTREQEVRTALQKSSLGRQAFAIATKHAVNLAWSTSGMAASYAPDTNTCTLNFSLDAKELATYFVHEMHHARRFQEGKSKMAKDSPDREEYVQRMVQEEIDGTVLALEARMEMGLTGPASGPLADVWPQYQRVYKYWRDGHLKKNPGDTDGADAAAKAKGRALVEIKIRDTGGRGLPGLGPNANMTYQQYYRIDWNTAHGGKP